LAFHGDLFHSLDVADPVMKSIDDLNVMCVRDSIPGVAETFHIVLETFIMLLSDGFQGLCCRWMLICALEVSDENGT
jgi:hypothetical protein